MKNLPGWLFNFTLYGSWSEAFYSPTAPEQSHPNAGGKKPSLLPFRYDT